jgi:transcriptional pleiotropic regulator of transition state genes
VPAADHKPKYKRRQNHSTQQLIESLKELIRKHPDAKQYDYTKWLGVSQGRVSQLKKLM